MSINKPLIKKIITGILWSALVVGFFTLWAFSSVERKKITCQKINIKIDEADNKYFVDKPTVFSILKQNIKDTLYNKQLNQIDWIDLEKALEANSWINNAEIFSNRNGEVFIDVKQRCPLMRIINRNNVSFYIDEKGVPMPLSSKFTAREIIVTGTLESSDFNYSHPENGKRYDLVKFVKLLNSDAFWKSQIIQIEINEKGEMNLYTLFGEQRIIFGTNENATEKLNRLKVFYSEGLNKVGWSKYKAIDVRFSNQIVAIKK